MAFSLLKPANFHCLKPLSAVTSSPDTATEWRSMVGTTISHYKVLGKIGQGGMGEVYRGEDTNLSRQVAIKVLPEQFTQDPQRLARFEREAKLLASLNHPNIAAIYGFEQSDDIHFLVLELVEGETLAERVAKGPLPIKEALEICRQIAEGVEAAHEKGVIHRDLKPANVKITPEGQVKILDFGLAKAFEAEPPVTDMSQSPTLTEEMTRAGVILGTAAYMSPEQARGKPVDKRADIFALGCVLYELLTAKRAFEGETVTDTLAKILEGEPDWKRLPGATPWRIQELLRRCLTKDAHDRLPHIANVRIEVKLALSEPTALSPLGASTTAQPALWTRAIPWSLAGLVAGALIAGFVVWSTVRPSPPRSQPLTKFVIPAIRPLRDDAGYRLAISPDGRRIVFRTLEAGTSQLYMRSLDDVLATAIATSQATTSAPFFSPDGEWLVFHDDGILKKVSLMGGSPIALCDVPGGSVTGSWGSEDTIFFSGTLEIGQASSLYRISAAGGAPELLATPNPDEEESEYRDPQILPGGRAVLFTVAIGDRDQVRVLSLETGEQRVLLEVGRHARYVDTGHLVYGQTELGTPIEGTLMAVPFDLARLEVTGAPVPILQRVRQIPQGLVDYAVSDNGTLIYVPGSGEGVEQSLVWVDRNGRTQPLANIQRRLEEPRLSPDGTTLSVTVWDGGTRNIWIYDLTRAILTPFTTEGQNARAIWSPDGKRLIFGSNLGTGTNIFLAPTDGSVEPEQLTTGSITQFPTSWSSDGLVAFVIFGAGTQGYIGVLSLEGDQPSEHLIETRYQERNGIFSPNGRWMAFTSDRSGQAEVYVRPYPGQGGIVPVSIDGGLEPMWAPKGRELFYRNGTQMMVVPVQTEPTFKAEKPRLLFEGSYAYNFTTVTSNYDVTADGQRFVMVRDSEEQEEGQIHVVLNWFEELKRLVPVSR